MKKETKIAKLERLRLAAIAAPLIRALNRPLRRVWTTNKAGETVGETNSHAVALKLLKLEGIETDDNGVVRKCPECGGLFIPRNVKSRFNSRRCKARANALAYHAVNPEKRRARLRKWRAANPEKVRAKGRAYRAAKKAAKS